MDFFVFLIWGATAGIKPGCERLAGAVAVANFYGFLLRRLTLTTASPLKMLLAAPRVDSDSRALSAKLVRMCEITANFHRCKKFLSYFVNFLCASGLVRR